MRPRPFNASIAFARQTGLLVWCAAGLLFFGCKAQSPAQVEAPADIAYVSLIDLAGGTNTGLFRWETGPLPVVVDQTRPTLLVGYSSAALNAAGLEDVVPETDTEALELAEGCDQTLPEPTWVARFENNSGEEIAPAAAPALTAPWVKTACPQIRGAQVELGCSPDRCVPRVSSSGCDLQLDLTDCSAGRITAKIDASGAACLDMSASSLSCVPEAPVDFAASTLSCDEGCSLSLYLDPIEAPPPFETERIRLTSSEDYVLPNLGNDDFQTGLYLTGYASDFVLMRDRAWIARTTNGQVRSRCPPSVPRPSEFVAVDLETLAIVATATAPRCVQRMTKGDEDDHFYATFIRDDAWWVGRFDDDGRETDAEQLQISVMRERVDALEVVFDGRTLALLTLDIDSGLSVLLLLDRTTLRETRRVLLGDLDTITLQPISATHFAALRTAPSELLLVSDDPNESVAVQRLPGVQQKSRLTSVLSRTDDTFIVGGRGSQSVILVDPVATRAFPSWQLDGSVTAVAFWPANPNTVLAMQISVDLRVIATWVDLEAERFLPGAFDIGHGFTSRLRTDTRSRVWALLPWAGELVRITPRSP